MDKQYKTTLITSLKIFGSTRLTMLNTHSFPPLLSFLLQSSFWNTEYILHTVDACANMFFSLRTFSFPAYSSTFLSISFISHISSCLTWMYVCIMCFLIVKYYFSHQSHKKKSNRILKTPMNNGKRRVYQTNIKLPNSANWFSYISSEGKYCSCWL